MKDLGTVVRENQAEAKAILNIMTSNGETIVSFMNGVEDIKDTEENRDALIYQVHRIINDDKVNSTCPCVIVSLGEDLEDAYVCAITNTDNILLYCPYSNTTIWMEVTDCCNYSENDIYMRLDAIFNN